MKNNQQLSTSGKNLMEIRYKDGYKKHLKHIEKSKRHIRNYKARLIREGEYCDTRTGDYYIRPGEYRDEEYYFCGRKTVTSYFLHKGVIKTHVHRFPNHKDRQLVSQIVRSRLNRILHMRPTNRLLKINQISRASKV